jgi:hypothetical protein
VSDTARIDLLEARANITDLVHRYAMNIVSGRIAECEPLFAEDATFEIRERTPGDVGKARTLTQLVGVRAIISYVTRSGTAGVCPMIHNMLIDVVGDEATSRCLMAATVLTTGQVIVGEYVDRYRREGRWRFVSRTYTMLRQPS